MARFSVRAWERRHKVRSYRPKKSGGTTRRRRYPTKRRRYPRKMSNKRILNVTSKKKRDNMQQITNMDAGTITPGTLAAREAFLNGNNIFMIPWIPTARPAVGSDATGGQPIEEAVRTSTTCYMRGVKENISIRTADGAPWKWRRICFRMKGDYIIKTTTATARTDYIQSGTTGSGVMRPVTNWLQTVAQAATIEELIFAGTRGYDWDDPFLATLDANRISIAYDKTTTLQSGNESGFIRTFHRWHGMNKNLVYQDDQRGSEEAVVPYSTTGIKGMGDYYIIDYFRSNGAAEAQLGLRYNSTLYWHEK